MLSLPQPCHALLPLRSVAFSLPPGDPRLLDLHNGGPAPTPPLDNLVGARRAWAEWPEGMDFLQPESPVFHQKQLERGLYLSRWDALLPPNARVLDLGGGIGRFTQVCLQRGCTVELVDPDLESLRRAVWHAAGGPGALAVHWSTGEALPEIAPVDVVIAAEVLCYTEDPAAVLARLRTVLKPGAPLLFSVEASLGWALSLDAPAGTIGALWDGVVHVPGDRWVRTFDRDAIEALFAGWQIDWLIPTHYVLSGPFETVAGPLSLDHLLEMEERLRSHPICAPLHRAWTGVARYI